MKLLKRLSSLALSVVVMSTLITVSPINVEAASNIKINGIDIGYAAGQYFSTTGKACTCHNKGLCLSGSDKCTCIHTNGKKMSAQCMSFALYCQNKMFGYNNQTSASKFKSVGSIAKGKVTAENIKDLISKAPIGSHIRTYSSEHSMILLSKNDKGFTVVQANGGNNNEYSSGAACRIGTATYTWKEYANCGYGKRGIDYVKIPKDYKLDVPGAPAIKSFKAESTSSITINWGEVSGATKYKITRSYADENDYKTVTTNCTKTSYTDKGLKTGGRYYYRVYAINDSGTSNRSETYRTRTKIAKPVISKITRDSSTQISFNWDSVPGADKYIVEYRRGDQDGYTKLSTSTKKTSYVHKGLEPNSKYWYRVTAVKEDDVGPVGDKFKKDIVSDASEVAHKWTAFPHPTVSIDDSNPTHAILSWNKSYGGSDSYSYEIYRKAPTDSDYKKIATTLSTKYTDTGLTCGVIYQYKIRTVVTGKGSFCVETDPFYAAPKVTDSISLTAESSTAMKISWKKPTTSASLKYTVRRWNDNTSAYETISTTSNTYYVDSGLTTGKNYKYYLQVRDSSNNYITSTWGNSAVLQILPTSVKLNKTTAAMTEGETLALTATISPSNATSKTLTWSSSNSDVAAVSSNGTVTAKAVGTAVISVKTSNSKTSTCEVTVQSAVCAHSYGDWITAKEATCTEEGSKTRVCSKCGETEEEVIPAKGHTNSEEWSTIKAATCLEEGEKAHLCSVCGVYENTEIIEKTEHSFGEWVTETNADCNNEGSEIRICSVCGETETRVIEAAEHNYELTEVIEPTLDGPGSKTYTCSICGDSFTESYTIEINAGTIEIGGCAPVPGDTFTIPVSIKDNPGIAGLNLVVNYDTTVMTPTAITLGDLITSGNFTSNLEQGIPADELTDVAVHWDNYSNITEDGVLFNITFEVDSTAPGGEYNVYMDYEKGDITDENLDDVMPDVFSNVITVADVLRGDVNLDRKINANDSILLSRYLAHWNISLNERQMEAANVYSDTVINTKDAVRLAQLLAGYNFKTASNTNMLMTANALMAANAISLDGMQITAENSSGVIGEYVNIPITVENNTGFAGLKLTIDYDSEYLTPVSITNNDLLSEGQFLSNVIEDEDNSNLENITVFWGDSENVTEDGTLFSVEFLVSENAQDGQAFDIQLSCDENDVCDQDLNGISFNTNQGLLEISEKSEDEVEVTMNIYNINEVNIIDSNGDYADSLPINGGFDLETILECNSAETTPATIVYAVFDRDGRLINSVFEDITGELPTDGSYKIYIEPTEKEIAKIKVYIWDSVEGMKPYSQVVSIT